MTKSDKNRRVLPMLGGLVSDVAALLRLGETVRSETDGVSPGNARRALGDQPDVTDETLRDLLRNLVESAFTSEYLRARGLTAEAAVSHNAAVIHAATELARRFAIVARLANQAANLSPMQLDFLFIAGGFERELVLRVAAYATHFDRIHPSFDRVADWLKEDGLRGWYRDVVRRAGFNRLNIDRLAKATKPPIDRNTIKKIKSGQQIPQNKTIEVLAEALHDVGLAEPTLGRDLTLPEIEFELRLACVVAEARRWSHEHRGTPLIDQGLREYVFLRARLRTIERHDVEELLARGTAAGAWPPIERELQALAGERLIELTLPVIAKAEAIERLAWRDRKQAMELLAREYQAQAASLREHVLGDDDHGVQDRFATVFESMAATTGVIVREDPVHLPEIASAALKADALVMQSLAPWEGHTNAEREALLRQAVETCPTSTSARSHLASHLVQRGKTDEALEQLRKAVASAPKSWSTRSDLALLLAERDRYEEALAVLSEPGPPPPPSVLVQATRGFCLVRLGRADEAETILKRVVEEHPRHVFAVRALAECWRAKGDTRKARDLERKADFYERGSSR